MIRQELHPPRARVHHELGRGHARSAHAARCHDGLLFVRFLRDTKLKLKKKTWEQKKRERGKDSEKRVYDLM